MEKKNILRVSKDGINGYFGGYWYDGHISYAFSPLSSMIFDNQEEINKAKAYLDKNGFYHEEMIIEYSVTKA